MPASTYTLAQLRTDLQLALSDTDQLTTAYLDRISNAAVQEVAAHYEDPQHEQTYTGVTLAASTRSYSLAAIDPLSVLSVKDTTACLLTL